MYALEFEADIDSEFLRIPQYEKLKNQHVKVILLAEEVEAASPQANPQRKPATVPPIHFEGDVFSTATNRDWMLE